MSQTQKITPEEIAQINTFHEVWKKDPKLVTAEMRKYCIDRKDKLWEIKKDPATSFEERVKVFAVIEQVCHMLGIQVKEEWRPKEGKGRGGGTFIATPEQREANCNALMKYLKDKMKLWDHLSPFEQGQILSNAWGPVKA